MTCGSVCIIVMREDEKMPGKKNIEIRCSSLFISWQKILK